MRWQSVLLIAALITPGFAQKPKRLVVVSWDAGADFVVDRLVSEGKLPNVAKLMQTGTSAEAAIPPFPSKTAVSHFAIFSGTWPSESGVSGNASPLMPRSSHTILETQSGFNAFAHQTEPLWVSAAKAGAKVLALSAAGSYPPAADQARLTAANVPLDRYVEFSGFESSLFRTTIVPLNAGQEASVTLGDDVIQAKFDGKVTVRLGDKALAVRPHEASKSLAYWSGPLTIHKGLQSGNTYFRVFPAGKSVLLYCRETAAIAGTETAEETQKYVDAYGGFHDDPFSPYQAGLLGKQLYNGGDGTAEKRVVECVRQDMAFLKRAFRYGIRHWNPDLVFEYSPQTDNAGHCWMGLLDPTSTLYKPDLARKVLPFYEDVYRLQDDWLGDMMRASGPGSAFALVSDHGMAGVTKYFSVNRVLKDAGLLTLDGAGKVDLSKTQAMAPPWSDFAVAVNTADWKNGIVPLVERAAVVEVVKTALLAAKDPETGKAVITAAWDPKDVSDVGGGGLAGGDLYLDFADGYYPSTRATDDIVTTMDTLRGGGVHGFYPKRRTMQSIFYLAGPGVPHSSLPQMKVTEITPILKKLMGW